jgi:hypothetical protein
MDLPCSASEGAFGGVCTRGVFLVGWHGALSWLTNALLLAMCVVASETLDPVMKTFDCGDGSVCLTIGQSLRRARLPE